jgi:hypothetical protein
MVEDGSDGLDGLDRLDRLDGLDGLDRPSEIRFAVIYMNFTG